MDDATHTLPRRRLSASSDESMRAGGDDERQLRILAATLSSITDFAYIFDRAGRFLFANQPLLDLWGLTLEQAVGKNFFELKYPAELAAKLQRQIERVFETGQKLADETPYISPTGTAGYYEYIFSPVFAADGAVEMVSGCTRDITARHRNEQIGRDILESITDAFVAVDRSWRFTYVNHRAEQLLDRSRDELLGRELWQELPGLLGSPFEDAYRRAVDERESSSLTAYYPDHDRWYEMHTYPAADGITIYFRNVTESERAETSLRRSEARYRTLFNSIDEAFCVVEMIFDADDRPVDYRFLETNPAFEKHSSLRDAVGRTMRELAPEHEEHWFETYGRVARTGEPVRFVNTAKQLGDRCFNVYAFRLGGSESRKVAVLFTDITEHRRVEQEREELIARLRDADRRKDEFLATLAHELRNPLAPIRSVVEVMKAGAAAADLPADVYDMLDRQVGQMVRLIDDLLDLSRVRRGTIQLIRQRVELNSLVRQAVETSRPLLREMQHELTVELPDEAMYLDADPVRLAQIFGNLLTNAFKYTPAGGRVRLRARRDGEQAVVTVKDSGVGIDPEMLKHVFDMFMQVDLSLERSQGGLGIGLTLVRRLVEMHGGSVEAHSAGLGQGSEFVVRLPLLPKQEPVRKEPAPQPAGATSTKKVLVVDDNLDAAQTLSMLLKALKQETRTVHDGAAALEAAENFQPDLMLLDIGLPKLNGYEVCRQIRSRPWGRKIMLVALTGWGQEEDRRRSAEAGFDAHLVKPVSLPALQKILANLSTYGR